MRVLIVGDGDFSFSLSFCRNIYHGDSLAVSQYLSSDDKITQVICSSFDSFDEVIEKYSCSSILSSLNEMDCTVLHGINAWNLNSHFDQNFDVVIWNHPHLGIESFRFSIIKLKVIN